jgi:hypothetical protein
MSPESKVESRKIRSREFVRAVVAGSVLLAFLAGGCPAGPQAPPPPTGGLRFAGAPADALVTVNESLAGTIGQLGELPVLLHPGTYRVQVTAAGCFPWYGEAEVGTTVEALRVELRPIPQ